MRRTLATLIGAAALTLAATGCGSDTPAASPATSSTPATATASAAAPESPAASSAMSSTASSASASSPSESSSASGEPSAEGSTIPVPGGLPVSEIPQMPGATVKVVQDVDGPGTVSFQIKVDGKPGEEIADWYHAAMAEAGFTVEEQYANGGFAYQGKGVKGDSASTTSSFVLGMSKAGS